ncbi:alanine/glycine:cation symporter family protein [Xanthovirga aplysinae]|uniref:alanine/glycine:cation symporter family protein n=1 Tax=Xanthovirga aplysinae TaxID=2529853 RepID=UPI0012BC89C6|nr:alanine/glycine:cation symporter family protein [Xanthovirga aplysinae]MTI30133.1 alanine:cation symporter family protein [Xanthovirga aplysinae]
MKKVTLLILSLLFFLPNLYAASGESVDDIINNAMAPATALMERIVFAQFSIGGYDFPYIVAWIVIGAIFFTFYLRFINLRGFGQAIKILQGKYAQEEDKGEVTQFQALTAALSGSVGLGNIAGVALAISVGGPGATFWMIIAGFLGMSTKFVECTLGVKFRQIHADGTISGGPMHYLDKGFSAKGWGRLGKFLAVFFSVMAIGGSLGGGNMFQVNQAAQQFVAVMGGESTFFGQNTWIFGVIMAILVFLVIVGGFKSIAKVTEKIVPFMCAIYLIAAVTVLVSNFYAIPAAFSSIFISAFSGKAVGGGILGALIQGIRRGAVSNEAGLGSAAIAHSAAKTSQPATEGFVASLEPFIDTVVVCTLTALVIVITGTHQSGELDGIALTSTAFETVISWFPLILSIAVILFALSTMLTWSYYGLKAWTYLFGKNKQSEFLYKFIFCLFIVIGASMSLDSVASFTDAMLLAMAAPNILGLYVLSPIVKKELNHFFAIAKR